MGNQGGLLCAGDGFAHERPAKGGRLAGASVYELVGWQDGKRTSRRVDHLTAGAERPRNQKDLALVHPLQPQLPVVHGPISTTWPSSSRSTTR